MAAISKMQFGSEVAECVLVHASSLLGGLKDEPLAAAIDFLFKAASRCQKILLAVCIMNI